MTETIFQHKKKEIIYLNKNVLYPLQGNPRKIVDGNQKEKLRDQIKKHDFQNPLNVYQEERGDYTIICGNHRFEAGREIMDEFPCIVYEGTKKEAIARSIADNKSGEWTEFDIELLKDMFTDLDDGEFDMSKTAFDGDEIKGFFDGESSEGLTDEDEIPKEVVPVCTKGDLWELGNHRLLCGDSSKKEDVEKLMNGLKADMVFTDPPYGINYVGKTKDALSIKSDNLNQADLKNINKQWFDNVDNSIRKGAYLLATVPTGPLLLVFAIDWVDRGWLRQIMVWNKNSMVLGHSEYHFKHELILFGWKQDGDRHKNKDRTKTTVWDYNKPNINKDHPTMKPVEMLVYGITNHTDKKDLLYEPFGGSGSTLIACEKIDRCCYCMEIDPKYCDVIIKRWEDFTGKKAVLNNAN